VIDLRSDTVTKPSLAMRKTMAEAEVGDDVFSEDPTVERLERETAELLGKEAALFTPTGCMANQLAIATQCTEGDEVIVEADSHIFNYETTASSFLSRVQLNPVRAADQGRLTADEVKRAIRVKAYYMPVTRLIALENTHNRAGGTVYSQEGIRGISELARSNGNSTHLDGARLWNACAYSNVKPIEYAQYFDTVSVCFSKGLGAPVGSAFVGSKELIIKARRLRKIWGGGMRQVGVIAAGALYALQNNCNRISEDHAKARRFAELISAETKNVAIDLSRVQTNIVLLKSNTDIDLDQTLLALHEKGVRLSHGSPGLLRAVTHMDASMEECEKAAQMVIEVFG
jgi:threonine aldolase